MSHLDWAISMGIFIVAILTIFMFLKPGSEPLYPKESIMPVVENNFVNDVYWTVKKVPLIINNCQTVEGNPWSVDVNINGQWSSVNKTNYGPEDGEGIYWLTFYPLGSSELFLSLDTINCGFETLLGAQESIKGINKLKLEDLGTYEEMKNRWTYPKTKDFQILVKKDNKFEKLSDDMPDPYQNANVYVKQIRDLYVNKQGELDKADIVLEVW